MKKRVYILSTLIAALCITGCSKSFSVPAPVQDDRIVLGYVDGDAELDVTTRATAVTSLSSFYAAATTGSAGSESSAFTSTTFTDPDSDGKYTGTPVWPSSSVTYNFYGSNLPITFAAAGSTVAATNSTDVVCAYSASAAYKTKCDLTFNHVFARLGSVTTTAASGYTISSITMSITPKTGGTYNIRTGAWSSQTTGSATSIANSTVGTKSNDIYLVPGDYTVTLGWTATKGAYSQTFSGQTKTVTLVGGRINSITATLGGNAQDIQLGVSITPWSANSIEFSMPSGGINYIRLSGDDPDSDPGIASGSYPLVVDEIGSGCDYSDETQIYLNGELWEYAGCSIYTSYVDYRKFSSIDFPRIHFLYHGTPMMEVSFVEGSGGSTN